MLRPDRRASARKSFVLLVMGTVIFFFASVSSADVPHMINYQGKLTTASGGCLNDTVQMTFSIYPDTLGSSADWTETQTDVVVKEGIFNVLLGAVDTIPQAVFGGNVKYLGVQVESDPEMRPLKPMVSVAYAYRAATVDGGGGGGNWTVVDSVLYTNDYWGIARGGAGNVFYGDSAYTMVNLGVACTTGTNGENSHYQTLSGGLGNTAGGRYSTVGGGRKNIASDLYATISGGLSNTASGQASTVSGGYTNEADTSYATVSGGYNNTASGPGATIGGGSLNLASATFATIGGGVSHVVEGEYSAIVGGYRDTITSTADYSYLFGIGSKLTEDSTFMVDMPHIRFGDEASGYEFPPSDGADGQVMQTDGSGQLSWATVAGGGGWTDDGTVIRLETSTDSVGIGTATPTEKLDVVGNIKASGKATIGLGHTNTGDYAFVAGYNNEASGNYATVGGGESDTASHNYATVGGGGGNTASGGSSTVGGGVYNKASGTMSTVGGGGSNYARGEYSVVAGGGGWFFNADSNLASGDWSAIGGGHGNIASDTGATVSGGGFNMASGDYATVGGGEGNSTTGDYATVGGGESNKAARYSTVGGGNGNWASNQYGTIGGGRNNYAGGARSTIAGGEDNYAGEYGSTVGGGRQNYVQGNYSTIPGGFADTIWFADYSYLLGIESKLTQDSTFMVDMPHIRFGDEASGYEFPTADGSPGQVMQTDGSGQLSWATVGGGGGWTDDGTVIRLETSTDSVGIGTATPTEKLDVVGKIKASGTITSNPDDSTLHLLDTTSVGTAAITTFDPSSGSRLTRISSMIGGGGWLGTYGPNGNLNVGITSVLGNNNHGYVSAFDSFGNLRAGMYVDGASNGRLSLWGNDDSTKVSLSNTAIGGGGFVNTYGPNGKENVWLGPNGDTWPNNGMIVVKDSLGTGQVWIYVNSSGSGVVSADTIEATVKNFRMANPNLPGTDIVYACPEGPEAAAYIRGTAHLVNGRAEVAFPDHFKAVASSEGITVQVTPHSAESKGLGVVERGSDRIVVRELYNGDGNYDFDYTVTAVRKGQEDYQVIRPTLELQATQAKPIEGQAAKPAGSVERLSP